MTPTSETSERKLVQTRGLEDAFHTSANTCKASLAIKENTTFSNATTRMLYQYRKGLRWWSAESREIIKMAEVSQSHMLAFAVESFKTHRS